MDGRQRTTPITRVFVSFMPLVIRNLDSRPRGNDKVESEGAIVQIHASELMTDDLRVTIGFVLTPVRARAYRRMPAPDKVSGLSGF